MAFQWRHLAGASFLPCWVSWVCGKRFLSGSFPCRLCFPWLSCVLSLGFRFPPPVSSPLPPWLFRRALILFSNVVPSGAILPLLLLLVYVVFCVLFLLLVLACCSFVFWFSCCFLRAVPLCSGSPVASCVLFVLLSLGLFGVAVLFILLFLFPLGLFGVSALFPCCFLRAVLFSLGLFGVAVLFSRVSPCVLFRLHLAFLACCSVFTWPFWRAVLFSRVSSCVLFRLHLAFLACCSVFMTFSCVLFCFHGLFLRALPSSLGLFGVLFCFHSLFLHAFPFPWGFPDGLPRLFPMDVSFAHLAFLCPSSSLCFSFCSFPLLLLSCFSVVPSLAWLSCFSVVPPLAWLSVFCLRAEKPAKKKGIVLSFRKYT